MVFGLSRIAERAIPGAAITKGSCASSLSYLARFIIRKYPIGRFDGVASDLVARRDAMKSLAGSGRKYYDFCGRWGFDEAQPHEPHFGWIFYREFTDRMPIERLQHVGGFKQSSRPVFLWPNTTVETFAPIAKADLENRPYPQQARQWEEERREPYNAA